MTTRTPSSAHHAERDRLLERFVDVPTELVWTAWTDPEHLEAWFVPRPFETIECEIDLRPGGIFCTVMRGPDAASSMTTREAASLSARAAPTGVHLGAGSRQSAPAPA